MIRHRRSYFVQFFPAIAWFAVVASLAFPAYAQQRVTLSATPLAVQNGSAQFLAHYAGERMLRLTIALRPPHMEQEEQFLRELQDPQSPKFHQFLSEEEWNARFAPSAADEEAIAAWAQSQGLTITQRFRNRLLVDVEAPAATIEKAFNVTLNSYQVGERTCFSNDRDPSIPAALSGAVQTVLGLNTIEVPHRLSASHRATREPEAPDYLPGPAYVVGPASRGDGDRSKLAEAMAAASHRGGGFSPAYPYGPADMYGSWAYDYAALQNLGHCCNPLHNPGGSPPEASIAIAIWYDFADSDLQGFLSWYPYLAHNVQRYFIDGGPYTGGDETTLDLEWTIATANSFGASADTAMIHVYEGGYRFNVLLDVVNRILSDNHARVLTMSFGAAEIWQEPRPTIDSFHAVLNQLIGEGWTIFAASGDQGSEGDCQHKSVIYPGSDPDVTSSGGTTLNISPPAYQNENGWVGGPYGCQSNDGGSGGGCSAVFAAPWYQGPTVCGAGSRSLPDMALNADWANTPQAWFYHGVMDYNGGTSIVAPELAGFAAQENAYLLYLQSIIGNTCGPSASAPCAPMGPANAYLYQEGLNPTFAPHYPFYDILYGCNWDYCVGPGFDQITGWGSANMLQLAWSVNNYLAGDYGSPVVNFSGPPVNHWYNSDQSVSWTITDTTTNGHRPNGVAGYSVLWDADPGDESSEPTPGLGNSFYTGPTVANTSGSIGLASAGPGCHMANLRAWDNAGQPTSDQTYGPICFDTVPPVTIVTLSGNLVWQSYQYYQSQVQVTFSSRDDLSGVAGTYYRLDSGDWQTYSAPVVITALGPHTLSYYSVDLAGNSETPQSTNFVVVGTTRNSLTVSKVGSGTGSIGSLDGYINCGVRCSFNYFDGWLVTLLPVPDPGSVFAGWSGCDSTSGYSCTVTVFSDRTVTATFNQATPLQFVAMDPCRVVDTRGPDGQFGGPALQGNTSRSFPIPQGPCAGIPTNAAAYALNVTVVPRGLLDYLTIWPTGQPQPVVSTLNSYDGRIKAAAAIVPAGNSEAVSVYVTDTTDVILDINGYFVAPGSSTLAYFALPNPCRVIDTRNPNGPLGGPNLSGGQERDFPVLSSSCGIPSSAQAYAFNVTVAPHTGLGFLTLWPFGQSRPTVSTLNAPTGTVTANAAIIKPGSQGEIAAYATQDTDLIVDINGYFAAPNSGQNPWSLYALIPCRALDTRPNSFVGTLTAPMSASPCALTSAAHAYVLNATVVPNGFLDYLTLWPTGQNQPLASTLNSYDGAVTSNMAIVLGGSGSVNAYASGWTQLILDISSYFGP